MAKPVVYTRRYIRGSIAEIGIMLAGYYFIIKEKYYRGLAPKAAYGGKGGRPPGKLGGRPLALSLENWGMTDRYIFIYARFPLSRVSFVNLLKLRLQSI